MLDKSSSENFGDKKYMEIKDLPDDKLMRLHVATYEEMMRRATREYVKNKKGVKNG